MSDDEFHVHGPHEHLAHEPGHRAHPLAQYVAIFTALLSTLGAVVSYQSAYTLSEAMLQKNDAVLKRTQAADLWNFYQAKSVKAHLMEMATELAPPERQASYRAEAQRYNREKDELKAKADAFEKESEKVNWESAASLAPHHRQAQAMTLIQIAISVASVTALTQRRWLFIVAGIAAAGGVGLWVWSLFG
ncbi:DUF4337 domain-containing protein [uncultured Thiodictyon sp.]|uniref:DUF4337 domain-containing protein n=1 Tax=uncultured Thiodictyon sp. TaxID=1846217 RepID=UPI0025FAC88A|nr:DUF4337 domain-containing protein [uncultured Thiodictyon sp.]